MKMSKCNKSVTQAQFSSTDDTEEPKKIKEIKALIQELAVIFDLPIKEVMKKLNQVLDDYNHDYGITDNSEMISKFKFRVTQLLFRSMNRRRQKRIYKAPPTAQGQWEEPASTEKILFINGLAVFLLTILIISCISRYIGHTGYQNCAHGVLLS